MNDFLGFLLFAIYIAVFAYVGYKTIETLSNSSGTVKKLFDKLNKPLFLLQKNGSDTTAVSMFGEGYSQFAFNPPYDVKIDSTLFMQDFKLSFEPTLLYSNTNKHVDPSRENGVRSERFRTYEEETYLVSRNGVPILIKVNYSESDEFFRDRGFSGYTCMFEKACPEVSSVINDLQLTLLAHYEEIPEPLRAESTLTKALELVVNSKGFVQVMGFNFYKKEATAEQLDKSYNLKPIQYMGDTFQIAGSQLAKISDIFAGNSKNILIKGEAGTGKTTLLDSLAAHSLAQNVQVFFLSPSTMMRLSDSGVKAQFVNIINEYIAPDQKVLFIVDEAQEIVKSGAASVALLDFLEGAFKKQLNGKMAVILSTMETNIDPAVVRAGRIDLVIDLLKLNTAQSSALVDLLKKESGKNFDEVRFRTLKAQSQMTLGNLYSCFQEKDISELITKELKKISIATQTSTPKVVPSAAPAPTAGPRPAQS